MGISSAGLGSGIDVESLITQLMSAERQPITQLQTRQQSFQTKISAFGTLKGLISTLETKANTLGDINKLASFSGTSSEPDTLAVSTSSTASAGTYTVNVTQLARAHKAAFTTDFTSETEVIGAGSLKITLNGSDETTISLSGTSKTLADLRNEINAAKAGVTATIVNTGTASAPVSKLVLKATETNKEITTEATGFSGKLDAIATINGETARPAVFTVDGLPSESDSNVVSSVIGGVTLTLKDTGSSEIAVARDPSKLKTAAEEFVKAYNDVISSIKKSTAYDTTAKSGSALTGDSTVRSIQGQLSNLLIKTPSDLNSTDLRLADIGIKLNSDGTLQLDSSKLTAAMDKDFSSVTRTLNAYGDQFELKAHGMVAFDGLINAKTEGLRSSVKNIDRSLESLEYRMTLIEKRYRTQFSALDVMVAQSQQTSSYLAKQLANL